MKKRILIALKIVWRIVFIPLECFFGFLLAFWCIAMILAHIGVSEETVPNFRKKHIIYVTSNGVHSDIVLPIRDTEVDWTRELSLPDSLLNDMVKTHFAFGWGDKGFFLETKSWDDLRVSVAMRAAFHLGNSAMHIVQEEEPDTSNRLVIKLRLTDRQYRNLIVFISKSFQKTDRTYLPIKIHPYGRYHYFFEAERSYGLTYTCNSWTNSALKAAGQKACAWTAFKDGIYRQYGRD
jgi:uncharacterized protein (TIGR02117 family)